MASKKYYYNDFDGKKVEYVLEKGLSLSQKMSFVVEVAGTVVSKEVGYAQVLRQPMYEYCLITYYTNIVLFENGEEFSLDKVDKFIKDNKENVIDVIRENTSDDERAELDNACNEAIEYRKLHYNDLKDEPYGAAPYAPIDLYAKWESKGAESGTTVKDLTASDTSVC